MILFVFLFFVHLSMSYILPDILISMVYGILLMLLDHDYVSLIGQIHFWYYRYSIYYFLYFVVYNSNTSLMSPDPIGSWILDPDCCTIEIGTNR